MTPYPTNPARVTVVLLLVASLLSMLVPSAPMSAQTASQPSAPRVLSWHDVAVARRPGGQAITNGVMLRYTMSASARELLAARSTTRLHDVPLPGDEAVTLELVSAPSVVDATSVFLTQTRDGEVRTTAPRVRCMRGFIAGDPGSSVFLSTSAVGLLATITKSDGRRWFLASERTDAGSVVVAQENDLYADWKRVLGCAAPDLPRDFTRTHPSPSRRSVRRSAA